MTKTELVKQKNRDIYLFSTSVENLFINELLPAAPGDYVKVYLMGLMCAEHGLLGSKEKTASILGVDPETIDKAWEYWESAGAVRREYEEEGQGDYRIVFISQIETFYGSRKKKPSTPQMDEATKKLADMELKALFNTYEEVRGSMLSSKESGKIADAIQLYKITPDVFSYAIKYCAELDKTGIDYIFKVAMAWKEAGCNDIAQVREYLDQRSKRNTFYRMIFNEMGFHRNPTPGDREMMDRWFDELKFSIDEVLNACRKTAGMREPSLKYVNKVLENKYLEAGGINASTVSADRSPIRQSQPGSGSFAPAKNTSAGQGNSGASGSIGGLGSGTTLKVSRKVLDEYLSMLRKKAEQDRQNRLAEVEKKIPLMKNVMQLERDLNKNMISFDFSDRAKAQRKLQREKKKELEEEKKKILIECGYPADYLEIKYRCSVCKDTGIMENGRYCPCVKERADEAYTWNREKTR